MRFVALEALQKTLSINVAWIWSEWVIDIMEKKIEGGVKLEATNNTTKY